MEDWRRKYKDIKKALMGDTLAALPILYQSGAKVIIIFGIKKYFSTFVEKLTINMWIFIIIGVFLLFFLYFLIQSDNKGEYNSSDTNANAETSLNSQNINTFTSFYSKYPDKATLEIEFHNRKRILEESIQLIQETDNLDILLTRYDIALANANWIMEQKKKGLPVYFDSEEEGFESSLNRVSNYHIVRIAEAMFIDYKTKMYELKTAKGKDNNTIKMFEFIEKCNSSLKPHSNKFESKDKLDKIHDDVEDFYSSQAR